MYAIADTHAIIWYLLNDPRLSPTAQAAFVHATAQGEQMGVPAICIVEIIYLVEKGRIPVAALTLLQQALAAGQSVLTVVPLDDLIAQQVQAIERTAVPDMPDRIIADLHRE